MGGKQEGGSPLMVVGGWARKLGGGSRAWLSEQRGRLRVAPARTPEARPNRGRRRRARRHDDWIAFFFFFVLRALKGRRWGNLYAEL